MSKTLHVVKISTDRLRESWGELPPMTTLGDSIWRFVKSNSAGVIDWENTVAYRPEELVGRDRVRVVEEYTPMVLKQPLFEADEKL